jgi:fumarate reductase flavoprotein subunit
VTDPIPIRPVVHYMMGGVDTDIHGATEMPGLYAAGEVACVSINGANRLGSNSLTECLVFGAAAANHAMKFADGSSDLNETALRAQVEEEAGRVENLRGRKKGGEKIAEIRRELNSVMESACGVYREQSSMQAGVVATAQLRGRVADLRLEDESKVFNTELITALELANMVEVAETLAVSAAHRKESRGAHTCKDFTTRNDQDYLYHTMAHHDPAGPRLGKKDVVLGKWTPEERKY